MQALDSSQCRLATISDGQRACKVIPTFTQLSPRGYFPKWGAGNWTKQEVSISLRGDGGWGWGDIYNWIWIIGYKNICKNSLWFLGQLLTCACSGWAFKRFSREHPLRNWRAGHTSEAKQSWRDFKIQAQAKGRDLGEYTRASVRISERLYTLWVKGKL